MKIWVLILACVIAWFAKEWGGEQPLPDGWWWTSARADSASCKAFADVRPTLSAARPVSLTCTTSEPGYVAARFAFPVEHLRGKRAALFAFVRTEDVDGSARMWLRADRPGQMGAASDDMEGRALKGTSDWVTVVASVNVPTDASTMFGGIALVGRGKISITGQRIDVVGEAFQPGLPPAPMPQSTQTPQSTPSTGAAR
jgi:hypothetical protein